MKLIRATAAECAAMAAAHAEAFADKAWRDDEFEDLLEGEGIFGFLAEDSRPAGVILCRVAGGEVEVLTVGVTPAARRRGVAQALIRAALASAREAQASEAFLEVAVDNEAPSPSTRPWASAAPACANPTTTAARRASPTPW